MCINQNHSIISVSIVVQYSSIIITYRQPVDKLFYLLLLFSYNHHLISTLGFGNIYMGILGIG